ncbi:hypothetical protein PG994_013914 [Apiospora phragmitis]|uniref:Uncharacterized protein n=1 Tax=Apiospora phragmitis TaxID=2905665 RepID=A0ABR1T2U2_9PEZI
MLVIAKSPWGDSKITATDPHEIGVSTCNQIALLFTSTNSGCAFALNTGAKEYVPTLWTPNPSRVRTREMNAPQQPMGEPWPPPITDPSEQAVMETDNFGALGDRMASHSGSGTFEMLEVNAEIDHQL